MDFDDTNDTSDASDASDAANDTNDTKSFINNINDAAERPHVLPPKTLSFYLVALLLVFPTWSLIPLSWAALSYMVVSGHIWSCGWLPRIFFALALSEVLFSFYYYRLTASISGRSPLGHDDVEFQQAAFRRILRAGLSDIPSDTFKREVLKDEHDDLEHILKRLEIDDPRAIDFRNWFRNWFGKVPFSSIRVHHVYAWIYSSVYKTSLPPLEHVPQSHLTVLQGGLKSIEKRAARTIPSGIDHSIAPFCVGVDKVNVWSRPFTFYAAAWILNSLVRAWLRVHWDVQSESFEGLEYLIRQPKSWDLNNGFRPIVFIHGLGLGPFQYILFLIHLSQATLDRPVLVLLQPHISHDIFHPRYLKPMSSWDTTRALSRLLAALGWAEDGEGLLKGPQKGITMLSHSNGSYVHAWMLKRHPNMITRSCFVDPVTFCLWEGDICYNFIYRPCATGFELLVRYYIGTELGIANLLQRNFDWAANSLWYEDIPHACDPDKTLFLLGAKDDIIHTERVVKYLRSHGIHRGLWVDPEGNHGSALIVGGQRHAEIIRWLLLS